MAKKRYSNRYTVPEYKTLSVVTGGRGRKAIRRTVQAAICRIKTRLKTVLHGEEPPVSMLNNAFVAWSVKHSKRICKPLGAR